MQKIQIFETDLIEALGIGKITEMHIAEVNGVRVLRITCEEKAKSEYKTIRPNAPARKSTKPPRSKGEDENPGSDKKAPLLDRGLNAVGKQLKAMWDNKKKPDWMK